MPVDSPVGAVRALLRERWLWATAGLYVLAMAAVLLLASPTLPFRFGADQQPAAAQLLIGQGNLVIALLLAWVAVLITRGRPRVDLAARAPERAVAWRETLALIGYAVVATVGGALLGHATGDYAISLHLPGTLYGLHGGTLTPGWVALWAGYNFVVWALVPFLVFRRRGYSLEQLCLRSADRRGDLLLILVILVLESVVELTFVSSALLRLSPAEAAAGAVLAFVVNLFGTVLPIMIFIYAILLPRYARLTGSRCASVVLGGVSYALIHLFDAWTVYDTVTGAVLSVIFLFVQYFGPGIVKSVLTLRTGNAWVHAWGYHAFAPHVTLDTVTLLDDLHLH
jgi:hypothetical protein